MNQPGLQRDVVTDAGLRELQGEEAMHHHCCIGLQASRNAISCLMASTRGLPQVT